MKEQTTPTVRIDGDLKAQRDQLAAMAAEALGQRDRLLSTLNEVLLHLSPADGRVLIDGEVLQPNPVPAQKLYGWWGQINAVTAIDTTPLALAVLASTTNPTPDQPPRVPADLPCPKCGSGDVMMRFCAEWPCNGRPTVDPEHFHRRCGRCDYVWTTDDVLGMSR